MLCTDEIEELAPDTINWEAMFGSDVTTVVKEVEIVDPGSLPPRLAPKPFH